MGAEEELRPLSKQAECAAGEAKLTFGERLLLPHCGVISEMSSSSPSQATPTSSDPGCPGAAAQAVQSRRHALHSLREAVGVGALSAHPP